MIVQSVHDELLHAFPGIVEFCVGDRLPDFAQCHPLADELEKVADYLHLLVYHPSLLAKLEEE